MGKSKYYNREMILQKLLYSFWHKPITAVGLSEIEKVTGVNRSGLYREFESKDSMISETIDMYLDLAQSSLSLLKVRPFGVHNIKRFLLSSLSQPDHKGCYIVKLLGEKESLPVECQKSVDKYFSNLENLIANNILNKQQEKQFTRIVISFDIGICNKLHAGENHSTIKKEIEFFTSLL